MPGQPERKLRILTVQDRYPALFNTPRASRHSIERRRFLPFNKFFRPLEAATFINPFPLKRFDLVHALNRVPLGPTPYIIGFESHLPREFAPGDAPVVSMLTRHLASEKCVRILPMSQFARRTFLKQHANSPLLAELKAKLQVRQPNIEMPDVAEWFDPSEPLNELRLVFVGGHFARKGGLAILKLAEKARDRGVPLHVTIVSSLEYGDGVWTDPTNDSFYEPYLKLLDLPNITLIRGAPNAEVQAIMHRSHVSLLPTFADTYGYSAVEGMANFTPVIGTTQGALPEFINATNGVLLNIETNDVGEWIHVARTDQDSPAFERIFADETDKLAEGMLAACADLLADPVRLARMRLAARASVEVRYSAESANRFWDGLYEEVAGRAASGATLRTPNGASGEGSESKAAGQSGGQAGGRGGGQQSSQLRGF
jgi:glycosyltransferase involved in cell wall biosynthesis